MTTGDLPAVDEPGRAIQVDPALLAQFHLSDVMNQQVKHLAYALEVSVVELRAL